MKTVKIQLNEIIKIIQDMKVEFNKELELEPLEKKNQTKIKCKMKLIKKKPSVPSLFNFHQSGFFR